MLQEIVGEETILSQQIKSITLCKNSVSCNCFISLSDNYSVMEENAKIYERKLQDVYNEIDKSHVRKIQKKMYECASACCDNTVASYEDVQRCIDRCSNPLNRAQSYIKNEFEDFQTRVQRCLMVCNDKIKEKMEQEKTKDFTSKYRTEYEECSISCLKKHCDLLPSIGFKIKSSLDEQGI